MGGRASTGERLTACMLYDQSRSGSFLAYGGVRGAAGSRRVYCSAPLGSLFLTSCHLQRK